MSNIYIYIYICLAEFSEGQPSTVNHSRASMCKSWFGTPNKNWRWMKGAINTTWPQKNSYKNKCEETKLGTILSWMFFGVIWSVDPGFCGDFSVPVRIQICPTKGIEPTFLFWGWDWNLLSHSGEVFGFLRYSNICDTVKHGGCLPNKLGNLNPFLQGTSFVWRVITPLKNYHVP